MYTFIHIFVDSRNSVSKLKWYHSFIKIKSNHIDIVIFSHKFLKKVFFVLRSPLPAK